MELLPNFFYYSVYEVYEHTTETNLKYALRSGGGSFGIVTEFLLKSYPHPETKSFVALTFIENRLIFEWQKNHASQF